MKLTAKIIGIFMLGITLLTVLFANLAIMRENQRLKSDIEEEACTLGHEVRETVIVAWQRDGQHGVAQQVRLIDSRHDEMTVRWITFDGAEPAHPTAVPVQRLRQAPSDVVISATVRDEQGCEVHKMYYPVDVGNHRAGWMEFSEPLDDVQQHTRGTLYYLVATFGAILACALLVTLLGVRIVGRPLQKLIVKTEQIGEGDFSQPVVLNGRDEFAQLGGALNQMSTKLEQQRERIHEETEARLAAVEQLRHADRLKTVGRLASGLAHELGTPLNVVSGRAELISSGKLDSSQVRESAVAIKSESDRMAGIIRQLLDFARRRPPQRTSVDLRDVAARAVELLRPLAQRRSVELILEHNGSLVAGVDAAQIQQVLTNLVINAIQAGPDGGKVTISLAAAKAKPRATESAQANNGSPEDCFCITVQDEGPGIPADDMPHLFEPFFTTKDTGEGTGLGLSVSYGIVEDHRGWIAVESTPGKGSRFTVYLPYG